MNLLPEVGAFELLVIAVVGLLVFGPKDLPQILRMAGKVSNDLRNQAARLRREIMDLGSAAEIEEIRSEVERLRIISSADPFNQATGWFSEPDTPRQAASDAASAGPDEPARPVSLQTVQP